MRSSQSPLKTDMSTQSDPTLQTDFVLINTTSGSLVIVIPLVMICAIVGYRKCRTAILRQRIQRLNRFWKLNSSRKLS